jgi:ABC-2 type transport system ATP-binding protein
MISAHALAKTYGNFRAVSGATFHVEPGSICALLGPNGAGKSTLVKILTGLLEPTSGTAEICGQSIGRPETRRLTGVLPENLALFDALTIEEHLELTGAAYKLTPTDTRRRSDELLRLLRIHDTRRTFVHQCSYGMRKKTALAMALLPNPRVLFLDEPFEGLDPVTSETLRVQLRAIAARGITILLTSHILTLVDRIADQIVLIRQGEIVLDRKLADLPQSLESLYFDLVEAAPGAAGLEWLGA